MSEGGTKQAKLDSLTEQITEEEKKWTELEISLDMMKYQGSELFQMKAQLQALINCILKGTTEEIDFNLELKEVVLTSLKGIRENIEPQVEQAKRAMLHAKLTEGIKLPWTRDNGGQ